MKRETVAQLCVFVFLVGLGVVSRLVSNELHVWNFSSLTAATLFAGYYLSRRSAALLVPLLVLGLSNLWLQSHAHWGMVLAVYAAAALPVLLRGVLRKRLSPLRVAGSAVGCSLAFFLVTNLAHWALFARWEQTLAECFLAAVPFYQATVLGDLFWSAVLFGSYVLATRVGFLPAVQAKEVVISH